MTSVSTEHFPQQTRVQTQWLWSYLTGQRSSRLIAEAPRSIDPVKRKSAT